MAIQLIDLGQTVSCLPVKPEKIPYSFQIKLEDKTYVFTVHYNETGGFFTVDLATPAGEVLAYGDTVTATTDL